MCSIAAPLSLADQSFNTLEGSGSLTYLPFALADASGEPCPSDQFDKVYLLQADRDLPPWLSIAHDPALHTISWSSQHAPAGINETFWLTLTATIGANDKDILTTSYKVGDPTSSHPLDAETAARCSRN
jgi:hypothetical protein